MLFVNVLVAALLLGSARVISAGEDAAAAAVTEPETPPVIHNVRKTKDAATRNLEKWGSVEMIGSGKEYEFIKALFGGGLHCKTEELVLAEPLDACSNIPPKSAKGRIVYAARGGCTFSDKAWFAQTAGAAGLIIGNSDQSIMRMPEGYHVVSEEEDPDPSITIPVVMVRSSAGRAIEKIGKRFKVVPSVAIVAKHWSQQGTFLSGPCTDVYRRTDLDSNDNDKASSPEERTRIVTREDVELMSTDGGTLSLVGSTTTMPSNSSFEFLRGSFGGPPPQRPLPFVVANPIDACEEGVVAAGAYAESIAIVQRGGCAFTQKMQVAEAAGAEAVILINRAGEPLVKMADGALDEDAVTVFPTMVLDSAGEQLIKAVHAGMRTGTQVYGRFAMSDFVLEPHWRQLNLLRTEPAERWGATQELRMEMYYRVQSGHNPDHKSGTGSRERLAFFDRIFDALPPIDALGEIAGQAHSEL